MAWYTYLLRLILCRLNIQNANILGNVNLGSMFSIPSGYLNQNTQSSYTQIQSYTQEVWEVSENKAKIISVFCKINNTH